MSHSDDLTLNYLKKSRQDNEEPDALMKAMNRAGLVQKEVQVKGKNGQTFTRKQWVKASDASDSSAVKNSQDNTTKTESSNSSKFNEDTVISALGDVNQEVTKKFSTPGSSHIKNIAMNISGKKAFMKIVNDNNGVIKHDDKDNGTGGNFVVNGHKVDFLLKGKKLTLSFNEASQASQASNQSSTAEKGSDDESDTKESKQNNWTKVKTPQEAKQQIASVLASGKSREDCMEEFKKLGVTWKENAHAGINWMRASMAMNKYLTLSESNTSSQVNKPADRNDSNKSTSNDSESKTENKATGEDSEFFTFDRNSSTIRNAEKKYGIKFDMVGDTAKVMSKNGDHVATCKLVNVEGSSHKEMKVTFTDGTPTKTYYELRAAMNPIRKKCLGDSVSNSNMDKSKDEFRETAIKDFTSGKTLRVTQRVRINNNTDSTETVEYKYNKTSGKIERRFIKGTGYLAGNKEEKDFKPDDYYGDKPAKEFIKDYTKFDMSSGTSKFRCRGRFL